ncbi:MAG: hypothetical protein FWF07_04165 [Methanomassiliicoccaceae archaeon]|nr:hypothetical protein [Methanomassiliicoccaceae archaeon]
MSDGNPKAAIAPADMLKVIMLAGAAIGLVSITLIWFTQDFTLFRFDYTGYDFYLKSVNYPETYPKIGYYAYMPFIVLGASAIGIIASLLAFTKHENKGVIAGVIMGTAVLVASILYIFYPPAKMVFESSSILEIENIRLMDHLGMGVYSAIIASLLLIGGGLAILVLRRAAERVPENE